MEHLKKGNFYGIHREELHYKGLVITDTEYTHERVDWHYHENAYFTYLICGRLFEANKKESYQLGPKSLLFHNWQDCHYNLKEPGYSQGFHIELERTWFDEHQLPFDCFQGSFRLDNPLCAILFDSIYRESKQAFKSRQLSIEALVLQVFAVMQKIHCSKEKQLPAWVPKLKEILHDEREEKLSLQFLSRELGIHPVHLSTEFPRYFYTSFGEYMRQLKLVKSSVMLQQKQFSLTEVAFLCGFADQSHFTRLFKQVYGVLPSAYRKMAS